MRIDATPDWTRQALTRLSDVKESVETAESIARDVERQLATKSSGCIFAKTDGGAVNKEITPAWTATKYALDALLSETRIGSSALPMKTPRWAGSGGGEAARNRFPNCGFSLTRSRPRPPKPVSPFTGSSTILPLSTR
jgi:hypothetical protein